MRAPGSTLAASAAAALLLAPAEVRAALEPTTTSITGATPDPSEVGAPFTVSFTVASDQDAGVPSGQVHVRSSDGSLCIAQLDNGGGSCVLSSHAAGEVSVTAYYESDGVFDVSSANASHSSRAPGVYLSGAATAQVGVPYVVTVDGTSLNGAITINYSDGMSDVLEADSGAPLTVSHVFQGYPGCYVVTATNGALSSNPLGVDLVEDDSGVGATCQAGVAVDVVAATSAATVDSSISATVTRPSPGQLLTLAVAVLPSNPTGVPASNAVMFADIRVTGSTQTDKLDVWLDFPDGVAPTPELVFFDRQTGRLEPVKATTVVDEANGRIEVQIDGQTTPSITSLTGTVFAVRPATSDAGSDAAPDAGDASSPPIEASADVADTLDAGTFDVEPDRVTLPDVSSRPDGEIADASSTADEAADASIDHDASLEQIDAPVATRDATPDRGSSGADASGAEVAATPDAGCGCRTVTGGLAPKNSFSALLAFALLARRRRSRATDRR
jgi:hypothetical protein